LEEIRMKKKVLTLLAFSILLVLLTVSASAASSAFPPADSETWHNLTYDDAISFLNAFAGNTFEKQGAQAIMVIYSQSDDHSMELIPQIVQYAEEHNVNIYAYGMSSSSDDESVWQDANIVTAWGIVTSDSSAYAGSLFVSYIQYPAIIANVVYENEATLLFLDPIEDMDKFEKYLNAVAVLRNYYKTQSSPEISNLNETPRADRLTFDSDDSDTDASEDTATQTDDVPFTDIANSAYADAIRQVYALGLMNGTTETTFAPDAAMTRAMVVTTLYRLAGSPTVAGTSPFSDVADGQWYTDAVIWAAQNGIVNGYTDGTFGWKDPMTREQMATVFYRYLDQPQVSWGVVSEYPDAGTISNYATPAVNWGIRDGALLARNGYLEPKSNATRGELAQALTVCYAASNP
jgi:uncharacterized membrane protein YgdD (TMEM256/DUF423 family)